MHNSPTHLNTAVLILVIQSMFLSLQLFNDQVTIKQLKRQQISADLNQFLSQTAASTVPGPTQHHKSH